MQARDVFTNLSPRWASALRTAPAGSAGTGGSGVGHSAAQAALAGAQGETSGCYSWARSSRPARSVCLEACWAAPVEAAAPGTLTAAVADLCKRQSEGEGGSAALSRCALVLARTANGSVAWDLADTAKVG